MNSLILKTISGLLFALLLLISVYLFIRGHNEPGGGFIGGLVGAGAFVLFIIAYGPDDARRILRFEPRTFIGWGLLFAVSSGIISMLFGNSYLTGVWTTPVLFGNELHLGTPLIFDLGVYLVVIGFTLTVIYSLEEES
ncbi:MAG: Na+/H+ antiporter subunit B [Balneolales bacterium]